jgi:hypothetical protein
MDENALKRNAHFWQRRFYDLNVRSARRKNEKLNDTLCNPLKRGRVEREIGPGAATCFMTAGRKAYALRIRAGSPRFLGTSPTPHL